MTVNEKFAEVLNGTGVVTEEEFVKTPEIKGYNSVFEGFGNGVYTNTPIGFGVYNGENTHGSLGAPIDLRVDARALRFRAYEANTNNDIVTILTGKFFKWVIGNGLKMQSEPYEKILGLEKVKEDFKAFKPNVEEYFAIIADSKRSDFSGTDNLHLNAAKAFETAFLGGDCLVILRIDENNNVNSQVIDGQHIFSPILSADEEQKMTSAGHLMLDGVVINSYGKHVAYYIRKQQIDAKATLTNFDYERIEAYGAETGCLMAWMIYGKKNRIDHHRGISMLSAILEKVQVLTRYTAATVNTAEERAKVVFTIQHGKTSMGENPFVDKVKANLGTPAVQNAFDTCEPVAKRISVSENRQIHNLPVDSELKAVSSQSEIQYEPFFKAVFTQLCAAVDIPPEVAMQMYNSNYSASRAAINAWGYIVDIYRKRLADKFYQPYYNLWLYVHILKSKVSASGYLEAKAKGNIDVIEAYSAAKFTGVNMPHIDPLKEIKAIRAALGTAYDSVPLTSLEQAAADNGNGDFETNTKKIASEVATLKGMDIYPELPETEDPETTDSEEN